MKSRAAPLFVTLILNVTLLLAAAVTAVSVLNMRAFDDFHLAAAADELGREARLLEPQIADRLDDSKALDALGKDVFSTTAIRVTVVRPDGIVAADSERDPATMDNHGSRPEVVAALGGKPGTAIRRSATLGESLVYAAIPLVRDGRIAAVLRTSRTVAASRASLGLLWRQSAIASAAVAALAFLVLLRATRFVTRPIHELTLAAAGLSAGDLDRRVRVRKPAELAALAEAFNAMADELQRRIATILSQSALVETIFASMTDGILAIDSGGRIIDLNQAAAAQIGTPRALALGRGASEAIRSREILEFVRRAQADQRPMEEDLALYGEPEQNLQIRSDVLRDAQGAAAGLLIVSHDVTRLRRLESLRKDFAANVSHELRTPITSIKGFVETLREGAINDPASAKRFLGIVAKEADRLAAIVDDLMSLARIEQREAQREIELVAVPVREALVAAIETCAPTATARGVRVVLECAVDVSARASAALLERAVVNLLDNALKYSETGREVIVRAGREERGLVISVVDFGCGIAPEHLSRVFERFYRVDKARSRELGGTGLGLAIVKHVAQALGGSVSAESLLGSGSTFSIRLP